VQPQVNVIGSLGYAGLREGADFTRFFPLGPSGFNGSVSVALDWSTANNRALGSLVKADAVLRQSAIALDEQRRQIRANVGVAVDAVRHNAERVRSSREASALYRAAVDDELQKMQMGLATMIDVVLTRQPNARPAERDRCGGPLRSSDRPPALRVGNAAAGSRRARGRR